MTVVEHDYNSIGGTYTVCRRTFLAVLILVVMLTTSVVANGWGEFVDEQGRTVVLSQRPKRIISLAPSITEILFSIGAGSRVVGVSAYSDYPQQAQSLPVVGDALKLNVEKIVSLQPDLVIADSNLSEKHLAQLTEIGLPVFTIAPKTYEQVAWSIESIGKLIGNEAEANAQAERMLVVKKDVVAKVKGLSRPRVFFEVWPEPLMTAGPGSFVHELISLAGGENIAFDTGSAWPTFSLELMVERDPEVIILTSAKKKQIIDKPAWKNTSAVKQARVYEVVPDVLVRTSPRLADGLCFLAELLHPEVEW